MRYRQRTALLTVSLITLLGNICGRTPPPPPPPSDPVAAALEACVPDDEGVITAEERAKILDELSGLSEGEVRDQIEGTIVFTINSTDVAREAKSCFEERFPESP